MSPSKKNSKSKKQLSKIVQEQIKKESPTKPVTASSSKEEKGLLLAKLLQKAVLDKKNSLKQSNLLPTQSHDSPTKFAHQGTPQSRQPISKNPPLQKSSREVKRQSISTKEKHIMKEPQWLKRNESASSFEPSIVGDQQIGEMLKLIYEQLFGEQKYLIDRKKYEDIEKNPESYTFAEGAHEDFNKEGKMLANIIFRIRELKSHGHEANDDKSGSTNTLQKGHTKKSAIEQKSADSVQDAFAEQKMVESELMAKVEDYAQENAKLKRELQELRVQYQQNYDEVLNLRRINFDKVHEAEGLVMMISELEGQLNIIREEMREIQSHSDLEQGRAQIKSLERRSSFQEQSFLRLSTIKQEGTIKSNESPQKQNQSYFDLSIGNRFQEAQVQTDQEQTIAHFDEKAINKSISLQENNEETLTRRIVELKDLSVVLSDLKMQLNRKEKTLLSYEKQIQGHEAEIQKYENFIHELSTQIEVCQSRINLEFQNRQKSMSSKRVQTDENCFSYLNSVSAAPQKQQLYRDLTFGQRQDANLIGALKNIRRMESTQSKQYSIPESSNNSNAFFKKASDCKNVSAPFLPKPSEEEAFTDNQVVIVGSSVATNAEEDSTSISLSQFSETEQLRDIRTLTKQLSDAYDKIIELTFQVNSLKKDQKIRKNVELRKSNLLVSNSQKF